MAPQTPLVYSPGISGKPEAPKVADYVQSADRPDLVEHKRAFALALVKDPAEPLKAGREVFPEHTNWALYACQVWRKDPEVLAFLAAVHESVGREAELPTSHEYLVFLWKSANNCRDDELRLKYLRLYSEVKGELKRPTGDGEGSQRGGPTVNVMVAPLVAPDDKKYFEVAQQAQDQLQARLQKVAEDAEVADEAD